MSQKTIRGALFLGHEKKQQGINTYSTDPMGLVPALLVAGLENPENPKGPKDIRKSDIFQGDWAGIFFGLNFFTKDLLPGDFEDSGVSSL